MAITHIDNGGLVTVVAGPLVVSLTPTTGLTLYARESGSHQTVQLAQRSATELFYIPGPAIPAQPIQIVVRPTNGGTFPSGTEVGLRLAPPNGAGDITMRPPVDLSGRGESALVSLALREGAIEIVDLMGEQERNLPDWQRAGAEAYHAHHSDLAPIPGPWSWVIDNSVSFTQKANTGDVQPLMEHLYGIVASAQGQPATKILCTQLHSARDETQALDVAGTIDWVSMLGKLPSPVAQVTAAVEAAASNLDRGGLVLLLCDGVPADYEALLEFARQTDRRILMVALGRSRFEPHGGFAAAQPWEEELDALTPLSLMAAHRLVGVRDPSGTAGFAPQLADALYPVVR